MKRALILVSALLIGCSNSSQPDQASEPVETQIDVAAPAIIEQPAFEPQAATLSSNTQIADIFTTQSLNGHVIQLEAALARAQAHYGVIPQSAADAITAAATLDNIPQDEIDAEFAIVRHRMIALLNVLRRSLDEESAGYLHYGATTVDLYDSARMLQMRDTVFELIEDLRTIELQLIELAERYRDTPMIGRTLGQHALPITFGKKLSGYIGENRRHIDRLASLLNRIERSISMKGAVGSYLGLGPQGMAIEARMASELGLPPPYPDDWHASRDVYAEFALVQSMISQTFGRLGQEVFLLQMTDIGSVIEQRPSGALGSSAMPHKVNPSLSEALIQHSRIIPRLAEVIQDDMINFFERDNTSRPNTAIEEIALATEDMLSDASRLLSRLRVDEARMAENLNQSEGWILSQRVVFALTGELGHEAAEERLRDLAANAVDSRLSLREALEDDPEIAGILSPEELDLLMDPTTYLGLDGAQVDAVIAEAMAARASDPVRQPTP